MAVAFYDDASSSPPMDYESFDYFENVVAWTDAMAVVVDVDVVVAGIVVVVGGDVVAGVVVVAVAVVVAAASAAVD